MATRDIAARQGKPAASAADGIIRISWIRRLPIIRGIIERRQATEALREGREQYQDLYENAPNAYFSVGTDRLIRRCNRRAHELLGYAPGKLVGRPIFDLYTDTEHGKEKASKVFQHFLAGETIRDEELQMMKVDAPPVWISLTVNALKDARGEVVESRSMVVDISARKGAEEALRESEAWLSTTLGSIADAVIATDAEGRVNFLNPVAQAMTGWTQEESTGRTLAEIFVIVNEETGRPVEDPVARVLREGLVVGLANHTVLIARDGTRRPIDDSGAPIRDAQGNITGVVLVFHDITERKRVEEALRESEELHRLTLSNVSDAIFITDDTGAFTYVCPNVDMIFGYSFDEVRTFGNISRLIGDGLFDGDELEGRGEIPNIDREIRDKAGNPHSLLVTAKRVSIKGGTVLYTCRDISERKRAEEALHQSEERYRALVELSPDAIAVHQDGKVVFVNSAAAELLHTASPERLIGRPVTDFIHPDYQETVRERVREMETGKGPVSLLEEKYLRLDGTSVDVEVTGALVSHDGRPAVQVVIRDITERKRAEEAMRESEEKYRNLVENINDIIYEVDTTGRITYINPRASEVSGYSLSEMIGRNVTDLMHPDDLSVFAKNFQKGISGKPESNDYRFRSKSGEVLWLRTSGHLVFEEDRIVGLRGVLTDITERKRMEDALQAAREELEGKVERQMLRRNPYELTFRELTVLYLVAAGRSDKEIGIELGISYRTARKHLENIRGKMNAASRTEASVRAVREGLLE